MARQKSTAESATDLARDFPSWIALGTCFSCTCTGRKRLSPRLECPAPVLANLRKMSRLLEES
jgi:hypothetical protein